VTAGELWQLLTVGHGWFLMERRGGTSVWVDGQDRDAFVKWADRMAYPGDLEVNAVPLLKRGEDLYHTDSAVLWTRVEDGRALAALKRFPPGPTAVLREGATVRHVALWALEEPLAVSKVARANKRIAHALGPGARKKFCDVNFRLSPPGTVLRRTSRPVAVHEVGGTGRVYRWGDVVGRLRDAPDPQEAFLRKIGKLP
jgi:hypothetical protein